MKYEDIRREIFDKYSVNFAKICDSEGWRVGIEIDGVFTEKKLATYVCPICYGLYNESHLIQDSPNPLTIEDVPPKSLKGKPSLLTCKKCNNEAGYTLDHHLKTGLDVLTFTEGIPSAKIKARIQTEGSNPFHSTVSFDKEKNQIRFRYDRKNPYAKKQFQKLRHSKNPKINFSFTNSPQKRFDIALLRIAHLYLFKKFGYSYLLSNSGQLVREQIVKPKEDILKPLVSSGQQWNQYDGVYTIGEPIDFNSYIAVFQLITSDTPRKFAVVLPGPNGTDIEYYQSLKNIKNIKVIFGDLPELDFINKYYFGYFDLLKKK